MTLVKILISSGWDRTEVLEHFVRDFYSSELIHETGVINSRIESRVKRMLENSRHQPIAQIHRDWYY